jgi:hypothetical protein
MMKIFIQNFKQRNSILGTKLKHALNLKKTVILFILKIFCFQTSTDIKNIYFLQRNIVRNKNYCIWKSVNEVKFMLFWGRVMCLKFICSNLDCLALFLKMSSAWHKKCQLLVRQKYAVRVPHFVFEQLIKKVRLLKIFSSWQNFCNSKI